jgi:hypothetical protein
LPEARPGTLNHSVLERMIRRIDVARTDSETALFYGLMIAGELVLKLVVAGLTAAVTDDRDRNRYRIEHRLVRADGLGEWPGAICVPMPRIVAVGATTIAPRA